jgi:hypothetical protein
MINILIIEDQIDQLEDMLDNLQKLAIELNQLPEYKSQRIKIHAICTKELDITHSQNEFKEYVKSLLLDSNLDILVIDYDLQRGKKGEISFDGDQVIKVIDESNELNPYIILASEKFNQKKYPNALLELKSIPEIATKQVNKSTFSAEWIKDGPNYRNAKEIIRSGVNYSIKQNLIFDCYDFPSTEMYSDGRRELMSLFRQGNNTVFEKNLSSDKIVAILIGHRYTYAIITIENNEIDLKCTHFTGNIGKKELLTKYRFLNYEKKVLLNSKYIKLIDEELHFKEKEIPSSTRTDLILLMDCHVDKTYKLTLKEDHFTNEEDVNPFYKAFLVFSGVTDPDPTKR